VKNIKQIDTEDQHDKPDDFVIATGENHSVREFVEEAAKHLDMEIEWVGRGLAERGIDRKTGKTVVGIDPIYFRPSEVEVLLGDSSKARDILGWKPRTTFKKLAQLMAKADFDYAKQEAKMGQPTINPRRFYIK